MSTKTLRKRIALVAVSAMGFGLLTSVTANAASDTTAITAVNIKMVDASADTVLNINQCSVDADAVANVSSTTATTGTVLAVGGKVEFLTVTNGKAALVISGPAKWDTLPVTASGGSTAATAATISQDAKEVGMTDNAAYSRLVATGVGTVTVTAYNAATSAAATASVESFGITIVDKCSGGTPSVANSQLILTKSATTSTPATTAYDWSGETTAGTPDWSTVDVGSSVNIHVHLRDAYKADLTTAGTLQATATNGAYVNFGAFSSAIGSTAFVSSIAGGSSNVYLSVGQDPNKPGQALDTVVTFSFNGVTIGTKSVKIYGAPDSIVVTDANIGSSGTAGTFSWILKDAAGNQLESDETATGAKIGQVFDTVVSAATANDDATRTAAGTGTFTCTSGKSGKLSIKVGFVNSYLKTVASNAFDATCGLDSIWTWSVSMDKASYAPGEIAKLTISAKDSNGGAVSNAAVAGAKISNLSIPGMTQIGTAATSTDTFDMGSLVYKFRVDQTEGSYVGQAQVSVNASAAAAETVAKTVQYKIAAGGSSVTNAEVLAAIVKLIASINKQITALQKMLTKKK